MTALPGGGTGVDGGRQRSTDAGDTMTGTRTRRRRGWTRLGVVAVALVSAAVTVVPPVGAATGASADLTAAQRKALEQLGRTYDRADRTVIEAFEPATVVPRMQRWHTASLEHQKSLTALSAALPTGACRTAVDSLLAVEVGRNDLRLRLIRNYRREDLGLVNADVVAYAVTALDRQRAEGAILQSCGVSPVDPAKTVVVDPALTPAQLEAVTKVQKGLAITSERYNAVFSLPEFVRDTQALQAVEAAVAADLTELTGALPAGPCRASLDALLVLEQQQATVRQNVITAGQAGNLIGVFQAMDQYSAINSTSSAFTSARKRAAKACGLRS